MNAKSTFTGEFAQEGIVRGLHDVQVALVDDLRQPCKRYYIAERYNSRLGVVDLVKGILRDEQRP